MISNKALKSIEYDKIMTAVSEYAVLRTTKEHIATFMPESDFKVVSQLLNKTEEAHKLLYTYNVGGIYFFDDITEELKCADAGRTLNNSELLKVADNLKSARLIKTAISAVSDQTLVEIPQISGRLYVNPEFEKEITSKILSDTEISDSASERLYTIRKNIRAINATIRERINSYVHGSFGKYLQDNVVTMRSDRYVVPVKSEYRSFVKGYIHDQSQSGSTVFIEPEQIMELNNSLRHATYEEAEEIHRILAELSTKLTFMSDGIRYNAENLCEIDAFFARAHYSFKNRCTKPILNEKGYINVKKGRHPLIDKDKVVPVSLSLGKNYNFLLITGPNTGGKTVTLKLTGLFSAMAMSGLFIPCEEGSEISVFNNIFCDIGDEQSIEQNLSTFSSHIKNIIDILNNIDFKSLVLLDEIGAGTDPDEGSALALAIIDKLLISNCFGIITTHYSRLKEFAMESGKIENASMEFDAQSLKPMYKLNIGIPGSSNALEIAKTLGLNTDVINKAEGFICDKTVSFEKVLKKAEQTLMENERLQQELNELLLKRKDDLSEIEEEKQKIVKEREKIYQNARQETKRIVAEKLSEAEEIIDELKTILKNVNLESRELFRAGELRNRLKNSKYLDADKDEPFIMINAGENDLKIGNTFYIKSLGTKGKLLSIKKTKAEAEVLIGNIKTIVKISDLYNAEKPKDEPKNKKITVSRRTQIMFKTEINVIGKTLLEALDNVRTFVDQAVMHGVEEIKIIHGVGEGILLKGIREYLKEDKNIAEFRRGNYGEGENGVTIVKLK